jgi:hypothetical protein
MTPCNFKKNLNAMFEADEVSKKKKVIVPGPPPNVEMQSGLQARLV